MVDGLLEEMQGCFHGRLAEYNEDGACLVEAELDTRGVVDTFVGGCVKAAACLCVP